MAVDPGVVGVEVPLFPALRIGSDPVLTRAKLLSLHQKALLKYSFTTDCQNNMPDF